jgi:flagellar biosynthesis/type III secretory pathway M-ring protein FliF/YscJ
MHNKLASLFALMGAVVLVMTWLVRGLLDLPRMQPEYGMTVLIISILGCYVFGRAVAWIGVRLVQEELAEKRAKEEELRHQLRMLEQENEEKEQEEQKEEAGGEGAPSAEEGPAGAEAPGG